jgi:phosphatidylglycerophosphatase A
MRTLKLSDIWKNPMYCIAFGFGSGLLPKAPGTWGTLAAVPLYLLIAPCSPQIYLICVLLAFVGGVFVCDRVSRDLGVHDYGGIVWDEIVGYLLTMFLVPRGIGWMIAGFVLFRVFDIWKPQPIRWVDARVKGGFGIMLDDLLAAIPAWLVLMGVMWGMSR